MEQPLPKLTSMFYALRGCGHLTSVTLNEAAIELENLDHTFYECSNLEEVVVNSTSLNKLTTLSNTFGNCSSLRRLTLPDDLTSCLNIVGMLKEGASFNSDLSNVRFSAEVNKGEGNNVYDYKTPLWVLEHKPTFV